LEDSNNQHIKKHGLKAFLHDAPKWFHTMWIILSVVFAAGGLWTRVSDNQAKLNDLRTIPARVSALETKASVGDQTQEKQTEVINKLADNVNNLSISIAKLQGQLQERDRREK